MSSFGVGFKGMCISRFRMTFTLTKYLENSSVWRRVPLKTEIFPFLFLFVYATESTGDKNGICWRVRFLAYWLVVMGGFFLLAFFFFFFQFWPWRQEGSLGLQCCRPGDSTLQQFWWRRSFFVGLSCRVWFPGFCYYSWCSCWLCCWSRVNCFFLV